MPSGDRLDQKTRSLLLVCFVQAGGVVTHAHRRLAAEGQLLYGPDWEAPSYGVINGYVKESPELVEQINAWVTENYKTESYNRLESCTADSIVEYNHRTIGQLIDLQTLLLAALAEGQADKANILRQALYSLTKAFNEVNRVPNRFRDGYHPKQAAIVDNSTHKSETLNLQEGVMTAELFSKANEYITAQNAKRFASLPPAENGKQGQAA